ncbi:2-dehydro-3-deoxygluconokinase [Anaerosporomusa subterranea]|uniref:2-dehydro-3-deoxygluconokinase n=1 Tax=Anaerosporomusa subterranea TaxID=1794912 RepID=A0A154BQ09_ANASB|nr:sugar kinase [Anaerosporomusa subterranea]KYZ76074.1 2-dehydro-3-deoxygluconokinase [Anaerosporomusa subterranea]
MPDLITLGESMVMMVADQTDSLQFVTNYTRKIAGAESNVAIGLARLGHHVGWISALGEDPFGRYIRNTIRGEGVDTSQVVFAEDDPTGLLVKELNQAGDPRVYYYRKNSAASKMTAALLSDDYFESAKVLHITGIFPALSESCCTTVLQAIEMAKAHGMIVSFDPNFRPQLWSEAEARKTLLRIAERSDLILPGIAEARILIGTSDWNTVAEFFHSIGNQYVVMKNGPDGAYFSHRFPDGTIETGYQQGFPVKVVVDTVGAGDGFAVGVLSGLLEELPLQECVRRGTAIGSMAVRVRGDVEGYPDRRRLLGFLQENVQQA